MLGYLEYSVYFGLDVQFLGLDVHLTSKPASEHPSWDSGYQGISRILIKSTGDIWVIWDIANNARYGGIRIILGIPGILGLGIIQDMRRMSNIGGT